MFGELIETFIGHVDSNGYQYRTFEINKYIPGIYTARIIYSTNNRLMTGTIKIICN